MHAAVTTFDPQYLGPSASQVETEEAPINTEGDPNDPKPASKHISK